MSQSSTQQTINRTRESTKTLSPDQIHGNPTEIPLLPLTHKQITSLTTTIANTQGVRRCEFKNRRTRKEALQIGFTTTNDSNIEAVKDNIRRSLSTNDKIAYCIKDKKGEYKTLEKQPDGVVEIFEHPLLRHSQITIKATPKVDTEEITWNVASEKLDVNPTSVDWENIEPLTVIVTGDKKSSITRTTQRLTETVTSKSPSEYYPVIDTNITKKREEKTTAIIKLGYIKHSDRTPEERNAVIIQGDAGNLKEVTENNDAKSCKPVSSGPQTLTNKMVAEFGEELSEQNITERVQLTVTSPPYLDAINYSAYESSKTTDYTNTTNNNTHQTDTDVNTQINEWQEQQKEIFSNVFDVTRKGGYCAVIIGPTKSNNEMIHLPAYFTTMMREIGWKQEDVITWHKITGGNDRFGTTVQHPYPTYYNSNQLTEQISIWRKDGSQKRKFTNTKFDLNDFFKKEVSNNIWHIPPTPPNKTNVDHPCPYPEEIPHRLINLYTYPDDLVLDPMAGSGTTTKVANNLNRKAIGIELQPKFVREARRRTHIENYERTTQKIPKWDDINPENATLIKENNTNMQSRFTEYTDK